MNRLTFSFLLLCAGTVCGQITKDKPVAPPPPGETLVGVWVEATPLGDEVATFTADGRAIFKRGPEEPMKLRYKLDVSAVPWKLDLSGTIKEVDVSLYTVFDYPAADQFRMAPPSPDAKQRPGAEALQAAKGLMKRLTLEANAGIHQVVAAHLQRLAGTWEVQEGKQTMTTTFKADGTFEMKVNGSKYDAGRFRIDVTQVPCALDFLSTEGAGPSYLIYEVTAEGTLRLSGAPKKAEERPAAFGAGNDTVLKKKAEK